MSMARCILIRHTYPGYCSAQGQIPLRMMQGVLPQHTSPGSCEDSGSLIFRSEQANTCFIGTLGPPAIIGIPTENE